jgi:hypothetical protein
MTDINTQAPARVEERAGPARDFASFSELELERLRNSDKDFDAEVFHEAVALVLGKIAGLGGGQGSPDNDHK